MKNWYSSLRFLGSVCNCHSFMTQSTSFTWKWMQNEERNLFRPLSFSLGILFFFVLSLSHLRMLFFFVLFLSPKGILFFFVLFLSPLSHNMILWFLWHYKDTLFPIETNGERVDELASTRFYFPFFLPSPNSASNIQFTTKRFLLRHHHAMVQNSQESRL